MNKKNTNIHRFFSENFIISKQDKENLELFIIPRLKQKKPINVFCPFTHITPNYMSFHIFSNLAELAKKGCNIICVLRDINIITHPYFKRVFSRKISEEEFIEEKINEIWNFLIKMGAPKDKIKILTFSSLWKRLVSNHDLFTSYYRLLGDINLKEYNIKKEFKYYKYDFSAKHILQKPADIFTSYFFHELMPELGIKRIDILLGWHATRHLFYEETRKLFYKLGLSKVTNPSFLFFKFIPRVTRDDIYIPTWDMSKTDIINIFISWKYSGSKESFKSFFKYILSPYMETFKIKRKRLSLEETLKHIKTCSENEKKRIAAENLFEYYKILKKKLIGKHDSYPFKEYNKNEIGPLGIVLKSKHLVEILKLSDGTKTSNYIAKKLNIHPANLAKYVKFLKKNNFLVITEEGNLQRKYNIFNVNLDII